MLFGFLLPPYSLTTTVSATVCRPAHGLLYLTENIHYVKLFVFLLSVYSLTMCRTELFVDRQCWGGEGRGKCVCLSSAGITASEVPSIGLQVY
jgi:hypothetical protein